jgi:hypothetical protein
MSPPDFFTPTKHMEALDIHLDLIECLKRPSQHKYWEYMLGAEEGVFQTQYEANPEWGDLESGELACANEAIRLSYSPTYWISAPILHLIGENVGLLPEDARIHPWDLVTQRGFAWFDHPVEFLDRHDRICTIRGVSWAVTPSQMRSGMDQNGELMRVPAFMLTLYSDTLAPGADEYWAESEEQELGYLRKIRQTMGRLAMFSHQTRPWVEAVLDDEGKDGYNIHAEGISKRYNLNEDVSIPPNLTLLMGSDSVDSWLRSFFLVIGQRLTSTVRPNGLIRRRMHRRKTPEWGDVRVIDLRRYTESGEPQEGSDDDWWVDWTHRHRVRAHWRRCWVKDPETGERQPVWRPVKGYIRGPDHLPVVERDDVFRGVR